VDLPAQLEHCHRATSVHALANGAVVAGTGLDECDLGEGYEPDECSFVERREQESLDLPHVGRGEGTDAVDLEGLTAPAVCPPPVVRGRWHQIVIQGIRQLSRNEADLSRMEYWVFLVGRFQEEREVRVLR
jgi:hypothetical protein